MNIRLATGLSAGAEDIAAERSVGASKLPPEEIAALRYAGEIVRNHRGLDENYAELRQFFSDE